MHIIITVPSTIKWEDYQKELDLVSDWSHNLNFKVGKLPKRTSKGDKCYILYRGIVKGWHKIVGFETKKFKCQTTGTTWEGNFILRSGPFNPLQREIKMKGFQGFHYTEEIL